MKNLSLYKTYIYIFAVSIIVLLVVSAITIMIAFNKIQEAKNYSKLTSQISINIHQANSSIKNYLLNIYIDHQKNNKTNLEQSKVIIEKTKKIIEKSNNYKNSEYKNIIDKLNEIEIILQKINNLQQTRGFKDTGLEGLMRQAVHEIENKIDIKSKLLLLNLRKHEKDFFLRKDTSYIPKHEAIYSELKNILKTDKNKDLEINIEKYYSCFIKIVAIEKQMGLTLNQGLIGELASNFATIDTQNMLLSENTERISNKSKSLMTYIIIFLVALVSVLILATISFIQYFNKEIINPISFIQEISEKLVSGCLRFEIKNESKNGILSHTLSNFNKIVQNYMNTFSALESILNFNQEIKLTPKSNNDDATLKLIEIKNFVFEKNEQDIQRQYFDNGLKHISILLFQKKNHSEIYNEITSYIVKYLKANQAGFFIQSTENETNYDLVACYAYNRKKYQTKSISLGEGLLGQCAYEKSTIFLTDLPQNYTTITSGLGHTTPQCIAIVPFMTDNRVVALFEICCFKTFKPEEIKFLEKCGDLIASAILNEKLLIKTEKLLLESKNHVELLNKKNIEYSDIYSKTKLFEEDSKIKNIELLLLLEDKELEIKNLNIQKLSIEDAFINEKIILKSKINELNERLNSIVSLKNEFMINDFIDNNLSNNLNKKKHYSRKIEYYLDN